MSDKKTKILWHGNSPWSPTGYGSQCALNVPYLNERYEMAVSSNYGLEGSPITWEGIPVLPGLGQDWGNNTIVDHARNFFGGDTRGGIVLTLADVWPLEPAMAREVNMACWCPVDHDPVPPKVEEFLQASGAIPIAMSRFGEEQLKGLDPLYVPHAVDTETLQPMDKEEARGGMFPDDAFVVGMVAANKGHPSRKAFSQALGAFARFAKAHENVYIYLHTALGAQTHGGESLYALIKRLEIPEDRIRAADQYALMFSPYTRKQMRRIYSSLDVLLNPSFGEGFGIPIIEAQSCFPAGTPIEAEDPLATWCQPYTGDLVKIETARGSFEATASHPVWTERGWQSAGSVQRGDRVLYSHAPEGIMQVHAGAIDEVVNALRSDAVAQGGGSMRDDVSGGVLPVAESRTHEEAILRDRGNAQPIANAQAVGLLRRPGGWRGNGHDSALESRQGAGIQLQAGGYRVKHGSASDGLAHGNVSTTTPSRFATDAIRHNRVSLLARRAWLPPAIQALAARTRPQGRSDDIGHRVDKAPTLTIQDRPLDGSSARDHLADPRSQYEAVTAVSRRHVVAEPVYNLTTASSTYRVGPGYLVHNCGVPVIVNDCTAMPELLGGGWSVDHHPYWSALNSWQFVPKINEIHDALEECYSMSLPARAKLSAAARGHALNYDVKRVLQEHWWPTLEEVERRISARSAPVSVGDRKWTVTVVTPWHNHLEFFDGFQAAMTAAKPNEVIVIDSGSDPALTGAAYRFEENVGQSAACNKGLEMASGDVVVFLNNDIKHISSDWLDALLSQVQPGVLVGPLLRDGWHTEVDGEHYPYLDGWCLAGMREDFERLGAWDTSYAEPSYYGDNDLCLRAVACGMKLVEAPNVGLDHLSNGTSGDDPAKRERVAEANHKIYTQRVRELRKVAA